MFQNFREHAAGTAIHTDIAIIGAGAAGISLARDFVGLHRDVLLIESGDLHPEAETLALNDGKIVGEPYLPLDTTRLRYFGGTTNHWDGHCRPLDAIDFEQREWLPHSGWPITREDLDPYYRVANEICDLGPYDYSTESWRSALPELIPFDHDKWVDRLWQYSPPTRFGEKYKNELKNAQNVTVLFNANVVEIVLNSAARGVVELKLKAIGGREGVVRPRVVVLACGGIENPRLLLASNRVMKAGIGNAQDLVGRFFLEHAHALIADAIPLTALNRYGVYFDGVRATIPSGSAVVRMKPGPSERLQRDRRLRNGTLDMGYGFDRSSGYLALRQATKEVMSGSVPDSIGDALLKMVLDVDGLAGGLYRRIQSEDVFWFATTIEQEPNPQSRVTLDRDRDQLGSPKPRLNWRLTAADKDAVRISLRLLGEELARLGIARMRIADWVLDERPYWEDLGIRYHNIGTTRMSSDSKQGVVDKDCKVHGVGNLYIAGSSVFPTAGYANPTLTIVALALRLADHLKVHSGGLTSSVGREEDRAIGATSGR